MKNNLKLFTLLVLTTIFGCKDAIDIDQPGRLTDVRAFESIGDLKTGLYWLYDNLDTTQDIAMSALYTDEIGIGVESGNQGLSAYDYVLTPSSTASSTFWTGLYDLVNFANRILEAAQVYAPTTSEQDEYNAIIAHATAIRAYGHLKLLAYYTPASDYANDDALAIPLVMEVPSIDAQPFRDTVGDVFTAILSDLSAAEADIDTDLSLIGDANSYKTSDAITAIKAIIAAMRENYEEAKNLSKVLVDKYPLATAAEYPLIFKDESDVEVIFKLERTRGDSYDGQGSVGSVAAGGWAGAIFCFSGSTTDPYFEVGRSLYNAIEDGDVRKDVIVDTLSVVNADYQSASAGDFKESDILYVGKYKGSEGQELMNDLKVLRVSEMYLIHAEAQAALGDLAGSAATLKALRDARFDSATTAPSFSDASDAYAAIVDERRIEFAFEGNRYFTLKRLGPRANRNAVKDAKDCELAAVANCGLSSDDYRFTLPIPLIEFDGNPNLRTQQNPGY